MMRLVSQDRYLFCSYRKQACRSIFIRFTHPQDLPPVSLNISLLAFQLLSFVLLATKHPLSGFPASVSEERKTCYVWLAFPGLGSFGIAVAGAHTTKSQIELNKEFIRKPTSVTDGGSRGIHSQLNAISFCLKKMEI